jgi:hypothetical protein
MDKQRSTGIQWSGVIDAVTLAAASSVTTSIVASLAGGALANLLHEQLMTFGRKGGTGSEPETPLEVLNRVKEDLAAAMTSIAQLEESAKSAQIKSTELNDDIEKLKAQKSAAQAILREDQAAVAQILSRGRVRGWVEGLVIGVAGSLIASGIIYLAFSR